jgi:hypothetical protein
VNASATGAGTGLSWANAFTDLQEGITPVVLPAGLYGARAIGMQALKFVVWG